mmetsp:Transcript_88235/g.234629  ORF Transcript_88235/g.234629 Transcript_88235/m.234629 type:complete len:232 (+) Transcript_88235:382-1077(+)
MSSWKSGSVSLVGSNMLTSSTVSAGTICVGGMLARAGIAMVGMGGGGRGGGARGARSVLRASLAMSAARDCADTCTPPISVSSRISADGPMMAGPVTGVASMTTCTRSACPARSKPLRWATAFCASASSLNSTKANLPPPAAGSFCTLADSTEPKGVKRATRSSSWMSGCRLPTMTRVGFSLASAAAAWAARRAAWFFSACEGWITMGKPHTSWPDLRMADWQLSMLSNST